MGSTSGNQNPWAPYGTYKDCSQGICSVYCPQWCYLIFQPPPPPFNIGEDNSSTDFSPLIIAVIGILASAFILISYYTIIAKYCRRRRGNSDNIVELNEDGGQVSNQARQSVAPTGLDEALIKSITVCKYKKGDGFVEGTDCSVCLSEFQENESLRLLPKCNHAFHLPCIDTWLKSHASCPLCRANITTVSTNLVPSQSAHEVGQEIHQGQPQHTNVSTVLEYQHRINDAVLVIQDLEGNVREESVISLVDDENDARKRTNIPIQDLGRTQEENHSIVVEIGQDWIQPPIRRSTSLNFSPFYHQGQVSIADILSVSDDDEENDDVGDYQLREREKNIGGMLNLAMKRSISAGRFMFSRYEGGRTSMIDN